METNKIIFLGDSLTYRGDWKTLLNNDNIVNAGVDGDGLGEILNRIDEVLETKSVKIFILAGGNDLITNKKISWIIERYDELLKKIITNNPKTKIYIQSVLPVNFFYVDPLGFYAGKKQEILDLNAGIEKLTLTNPNYFYLNLHNKFQNAIDDLLPNYTTDGIHLSDTGYKHWVKILNKEKLV